MNQSIIKRNTIAIILFLCFLVSRSYSTSPIISMPDRFKIFTVKKTYDQAYRECKKRGGSLAKITSPDVNHFLRNNIKMYKFTKTSFWIGLNNKNMERRFVWADNAKLGCYSNWYSGKRNIFNEGSQEKKSCVRLWNKRGYKWDQTDCQARNGFICQFVECPDGMWKNRWSYSCVLCNCLEGDICDKTTGDCSLGCAAGYGGRNCQRRCRRGRWGVGCRNKCGKCRDSRMCNHIDGSCRKGCKSGYIGSLCTEEENLSGCLDEKGVSRKPEETWESCILPPVSGKMSCTCLSNGTIECDRTGCPFFFCPHNVQPEITGYYGQGVCCPEFKCPKIDIIKCQDNKGNQYVQGEQYITCAEPIGSGYLSCSCGSECTHLPCPASLCEDNWVVLPSTSLREGQCCPDFNCYNSDYIYEEYDDDMVYPAAVSYEKGCYDPYGVFHTADETFLMCMQPIGSAYYKCQCMTNGYIKCNTPVLCKPVPKACPDGSKPVIKKPRGEECCSTFTCPPVSSGCNEDGTLYAVGETLKKCADPPGTGSMVCECTSEGDFSCSKAECSVISCPDEKPPTALPLSEGYCCPELMCPSSDDDASCQGRCGEHYDGVRVCYCDEACTHYGNCCENYVDAGCLTATEPCCVTRIIQSSGSSAQVHCEIGEIMTGCTAITSEGDSPSQRKGEEILIENDNTVCVAYNIENAVVTALAQCCAWPGLVCSYSNTTETTETNGKLVGLLKCPTKNSFPLGCMAKTKDGLGYMGSLPDVVATFNDELNSFISPSCFSAFTIDSQNDVTQASCCTSPDLDCKVKISYESPMTPGGISSVKCDAGYRMTGCTSFSFFPGPGNFVSQDDSTCGVLTSSNGETAYAVATCCMGTL